MLVLTRKPDQQILIGENIRITIVRVKGQSVRIGIEAPQEVRVMRTELTVDEEAAQPQQTGSNATVAAPAVLSTKVTHSANSKPAPATMPTEQSAAESRRNPFLPLAGRTPGTSSASSVRRPQRLGPAVLRSMAGKI